MKGHCSRGYRWERGQTMEELDAWSARTSQCSVRWLVAKRTVVGLDEYLWIGVVRCHCDVKYWLVCRAEGALG